MRIYGMKTKQYKTTKWKSPFLIWWFFDFTNNRMKQKKPEIITKKRRVCILKYNAMQWINGPCEVKQHKLWHEIFSCNKIKIANRLFFDWARRFQTILHEILKKMNEWTRKKKPQFYSKQCAKLVAIGIYTSLYGWVHSKQ